MCEASPIAVSDKALGPDRRRKEKPDPHGSPAAVSSVDLAEEQKWEIKEAFDFFDAVGTNSSGP